MTCDEYYSFEVMRSRKGLKVGLNVSPFGPTNFKRIVVVLTRSEERNGQPAALEGVARREMIRDERVERRLRLRLLVLIDCVCASVGHEDLHASATLLGVDLSNPHARDLLRCHSEPPQHRPVALVVDVDVQHNDLAGEFLSGCFKILESLLVLAAVHTSNQSVSTEKRGRRTMLNGPPKREGKGGPYMMLRIAVQMQCFYLENLTFQGCFLHHFCIFNREFRGEMACILQFAAPALRIKERNLRFDFVFH